MRASSRLVAWAILLSWCGLPAPALDLEALEEDWRWAAFDDQSGLPSNSITGLVEANDGTMWAGTERGVAWFDGWTWRATPIGASKNGQPLIGLMVPHGHDQVLLQAEGTLYLGGRQGFHPLTTLLTRRGEHVLSFAQDDKGLVILRTEAGLYTWDRRTLRAEPEPSQGSWRGRPLLVAGSHTTPWLLHSGRLYRWKNRGWREMRSPVPVDGLQMLSEDRSGTITVHLSRPAQQSGLWEVDSKGRWRYLNELTRARPLTVTHGSDGRSLMLLESGTVLARRDGSWSPVRGVHGYMRKAHGYLLTRTGDLWVAGWRGVYLYRANSQMLTRWSRVDEGTSRELVNEFLETREGEYWVGTSDGIEIRAVGNASAQPPRVLEFAGTQRLTAITGLGQDQWGHIWVTSGSAFGGALRWDGSHWKHFRAAEGLTDGPIHRVWRSPGGRLWFLAGHVDSAEPSQGAYEMTGPGQFRRWGQKDGLVSSAVVTMSRGTDGSLWFGTQRGLSRLEPGAAGGRWRHWDETSGLKRNQIFVVHCPNVRDAADAPKAWFGDRRNGLGYIDREGNPRYLLDADDGLRLWSVWDIEEDSKGRLWVATREGLASYHRGIWSDLRMAFGFHQRAIWPLMVSGEALLVGTFGSGTVVLRPQYLTGEPPQVTLEHLAGQQGLSRFRWHVHNHRGMDAGATPLSRWRLDGGSWSGWSSRREFAGELNGGPHTFEVQAKGPLGQLTEPSVLRFEVPRPIHEHPLFFPALITVLTAVIAQRYRAGRRRRRYLAELKAARDRAEQAASAKTDFLATVSHEIRTPMNGILGMTALLLESGLNSHQRDMADVVRFSTDRLLALVNDLLDFAKIEEARLEFESAPFDLAKLAEETMALCGAAANERGIELALFLDPALPRYLLGDAHRVRQVLLNLLSNSVKFTDRGEAGIDIFCLDRKDNRVFLEIRVFDSGIGIPNDKLTLLFQKFSQVDTSSTRRHGGSGLGLAICRGLLERMGGSIDVSSTPGVGSVFTARLALPMAEAPSTEQPVATPAPPPRVLLAYRNTKVRRSLQSYLEAAGYETFGASSAADWRSARELVPNFDLWVVEDCPSFEAAGAPARRTIGIRRLDSPPPADRCDQWLAKPVRPSVLLKAVGRMLEEATSKQPAAAPQPVQSSVQPGRRVLLVDDDGVSQKVAVLLLARAGYEVEVANSGLEALDLFTMDLRRPGRRKYDAILLDCQMPEMDGYVAAAEMRKAEQGAGQVRTPIIALTANAMREDRQRCLDAGMDDFLPKPVDKEALRAKLALWIAADGRSPTSSDSAATAEPQAV